MLINKRPKLLVPKPLDTPVTQLIGEIKVVHVR